MSMDLTEEQRMVRQAAAEFARNEIAPHARENDRNQHFDLDLVAKVAGMGYLGAPVAEDHGGGGLDWVSYALIVEEIGKACSSMRTVVSVQTSLVASTIERWGTDKQRQEFLPKLCSGQWLGCFGLTEPDAGSDPASLRTTATTRDGGWSLTGQKVFISLGCNAKVALIFAKTDTEAGHRGISCFVVPCEREGFSSSPVHGKLGLRASDTAELALDGVEVSEDDMLGGPGDGFKVAMSALDAGRYSVAAGCVGIIQGCLEASVVYSKEREQFQRPIASFQLVQELIADIAVEADAARLLVWRAGNNKNKGEPATLETSIAKYYASEAAVRAANSAIQVHGGYGYVDDYPLERYLRDARVTTLYEGTSQIQKLIIGRELTGISAFT